MSIIAGALGEHGHDVEIADWFGSGESTEWVLDAVQRHVPDLVGLSVRNLDNANSIHQEGYVAETRELIRDIRARSDAPILLGGSGFSLMPERFLEAVGADYGIVGEGEALVVEFARDLERGVRPDGACIRTGDYLPGGRIRGAAYDSGLVKSYIDGGSVIPIQTKRGCNEACVYCTYPLLEGRHVRSRPPKDVVDDVVRLRERDGVEAVFFVDSLFNDDDGAYLDVLREMDRRGVSIPWTAFFKPAVIPDDVMDLMKRTGIEAVEIGADASTDATLRRLGKRFTFDDVVRSNDQFTAWEISTSHYFMFGGPGETRETAVEGARNVIGLTNTVSVVFMGIRIYPGSGLERIAVREGVVAPDANLLEPTYYFSPQLERAWLERTLTEAFAPVRHCIFPPDALDDKLRILHKLGFKGSLCEMLLPAKRDRAK